MGMTAKSMTYTPTIADSEPLLTDHYPLINTHLSQISLSYCISILNEHSSKNHLFAYYQTALDTPKACVSELNKIKIILISI